jgi:acyl-CoA thioester hydrolase
VSRIHTCPFTVPPESIDAMGHVNNHEYVRWMQEAATGHSVAQGWPLERYVARGQGWFVRRHTVEYLRPAFAGDALALLTWVASFERSSSPRRYLFYRAADRTVVARAETLWVFVDLRTGAPVRIPAELRSAFEVVADDGEALQVARGAPRLHVTAPLR